MEANEKVIQSYLPHGLGFEDTEYRMLTGEHRNMLTIPSGTDTKNIVITTDEVLGKLADDPTWKAITSTKLIRILGDIPAKYRDQSENLIKAREQLNGVQDANNALKEEKNALEAKNAELLKRIAALENGDSMPTIDPSKLAAAKAAAANAKK
jgi:hypothetical protein